MINEMYIQMLTIEYIFNVLATIKLKILQSTNSVEKRNIIRPSDPNQNKTYTDNYFHFYLKIKNFLLFHVINKKSHLIVKKFTSCTRRLN